MMRQLRIYTIRVQGHLSPRWSEWFEEMEIVHSCNGQTALVGPLPDQAALFGLLLKIRDLGLELLALESQTVSPGEQSGAHRHQAKDADGESAKEMPGSPTHIGAWNARSVAKAADE